MCAITHFVCATSTRRFVRATCHFVRATLILCAQIFAPLGPPYGSSPLNGSKEKMAHRSTLLDRYSITIGMTVGLLMNRWVTWGPDPVVNMYIGVGTGSEQTDGGRESDSYCEERKVVKTWGPVQRCRLAQGCMNPLNQTKRTESVPAWIRIGNRSFKKVHSACQ